MQIYVDHAEGLKCPRCRKYTGIQDLPLGICDWCAKALLESKVTDFTFPTSEEQEDFIQLQNEIKESYKQQVEKYKKR